MKGSDIYLLAGLEIGIILFALFALFIDIKNKIIERKEGVFGITTRSAKTMTMLHTVYGSSVASILIIVTNAKGIEGHKVALILIPYICITYLFYFSLWFRNAIFLPISEKIKKD